MELDLNLHCYIKGQIESVDSETYIYDIYVYMYVYIYVCAGFQMLIVTFWFPQSTAQSLDFHLGKPHFEEETRDSQIERDGYFGLKFISKSYTFTFLEMQVK